MFRLTLELEDTTVEAQSPDGSEWSAAITDSLTRKVHTINLSSDNFGILINAAIAGVDDGPLYLAAAPFMEGAPRECRIIP